MLNDNYPRWKGSKNFVCFFDPLVYKTTWDLVEISDNIYVQISDLDNKYSVMIQVKSNSFFLKILNSVWARHSKSSSKEFESSKISFNLEKKICILFREYFLYQINDFAVIFFDYWNVCTLQIMRM